MFLSVYNIGDLMSTEKNTVVKPGDIVTSLERGLGVLKCFDQHAVNLTPADVAKRTNLPRATARRILITLVKLGYAVTEGKRYRLTPKVLDLAHVYLARINVSEVIEPVLFEAMQKTDETCTLMIKDGNDMVCIASSCPDTLGHVSVEAGLRLPLYGSSAGRCLLAALSATEMNSYLSGVKLVPLTPKTIVRKSDFRKEISRIRNDGYAMTVDEFAIGIFSIGVPVPGASGNFLAGITCLGNVARIQTTQEKEYIVSALRDAAARISLLLPDNFDFLTDGSRQANAI